MQLADLSACDLITVEVLAEIDSSFEVYSSEPDMCIFQTSDSDTLYLGLFGLEFISQLKDQSSSQSDLTIGDLDLGDGGFRMDGQNADGVQAPPSVAWTHGDVGLELIVGMDRGDVTDAQIISLCEQIDANL